VRVREMSPYRPTKEARSDRGSSGKVFEGFCGMTEVMP
jgi:hypothetical protein